VKIHLLPPELTHKIAAGEVIERPASILKELLENSLDAGATVLQIDLVKGGCASLRLTDNGAGMAPAEVPLAFQRHATSKLAEFDDLYRLRTFGFRGEALPSIAAVSRVELATREPAETAGTLIVMEGGRVEELRETGCPAGTAIFVSRIFANVPVRKKFLKSEATEQGACLEAITRIALAHPGVKIRVLNNGRPLWDLPATAAAGERIAMILGREAGDGLLKVSGVRENMVLAGHISRPEVSRANARGIYCYVNGRYIRDSLLSHAIMTAYRNIMAAKRYPLAVLYLTVAPEDVDVNVHPAKLEVRFRDPRAIYGLVVESLLAGLAAVSPAAAGLPPAPISSASGAPVLPAYQSRIEEALKRYTLYGGAKKTSYRAGTSTLYRSGALFGPRPGPDAGAPGHSGGTTADGQTGSPGDMRSPLGHGADYPEDAAAGGKNRTEDGPLPAPGAAGEANPAGDGRSADDRPSDPAASSFVPSYSNYPVTPAGASDRQRFLADMTYLGQTGGTYLVFTHDDDLLLVDQHAAHERILYEELRRGAGEGKAAVQPLLLPEIIALSPGNYGLLMEHREFLAATGLETEPFGGHTVAVRSLPAMLGHLNPGKLLAEFLEQLTGEGAAAPQLEKREQVLISLACRGAVKAGQLLTENEVARLCRDLDRLPFAGTCPHGRPVWIVLTGKQLAGLFKRT